MPRHWRNPLWRVPWRDFAGRKVLITGGSRGLGLTLAEVLIADGAQVALLARDVAGLYAAQRQLRQRLGAEVELIGCDLGKPAELEGALADLLQRWGRVDVLINNAGIIAPGAADAKPLAEYEQAMEVHYWAPLRAMRALMPAMIARGDGRIVNVSALEGTLALPLIAPYCASKFALTGLSNALRAELARSGVYVTTVVPGLMRPAASASLPVAGEGRLPALIARAARSPLLSSTYESAARRIARACRRGDRWLSLDALSRVLRIADALAPSGVGACMELAAALLKPR